jgi:hypothetical protein
MNFWNTQKNPFWRKHLVQVEYIPLHLKPLISETPPPAWGLTLHKKSSHTGAAIKCPHMWKRRNLLWFVELVPLDKLLEWTSVRKMGTRKPLGWYLGTIDTLPSCFELVCIYWYKLDCKSFLGQIFYAVLKSVCNMMTVGFLQVDVHKPRICCSVFKVPWKGVVVKVWKTGLKTWVT